MQRRQQGTARGGRASVKSQRRVNTQQTRNATKKKPQQQKENASKQQHTAPVGVSGVPLAARFSSLQKEALAHHKGPATKSKKSNVVVNIKKPGQQVAKKAVKQQQKTQQQQKQKLQQVTQANRTKRQATVNQRRKGLEVAPPATKAGKKNKANGANAAAVVGKPKKKMGAKATDDKKKKPVTGEDLDVEMDEYWHEAGKGPDPKQAQLDRQMEEYWAGKPKRDGDDAPASETPSA